MFRLLSLSFPVFLLSLFVAAGHGAEIAPQLQSEMTAALPGETLPVIVTFAAEADLRPLKGQPKKMRRSGVVRALRETADLSQKEVKRLLKGRGKKFHDLWIVNGLALEATPELIETLAAMPEVAQIEYDETVRLPEVTPSQVAVEWNLAAIHADDFWSTGFTGQGVTVAILDSGVDINHPDLAGSYLGGSSGWFDPYLKTTAPYDKDGHGTSVAGVIVGGSADGKAIGVAPGATWIAGKIFRDDGTAESSQIFNVFQWILDPDGNPESSDSVADVVNNSWGIENPGVCEGSFFTAVENLKKAGIAVVFSAGNTGPDASTSLSPGNYANSFAVGSVGPYGVISRFSSRGPAACDGTIFPEVVAPGEFIKTSDLSNGGFANYRVLSGTSFSAPQVAGVMALLLSQDPSLTPAELEAVLKSSATDLGDPGPDNLYGYGLVDALAAYNLLAGSPDISVHDLTPPENDLQFDFGHVPPNRTADRVVTLRNTGDGLLYLFGIGVKEPFSIVADTCSNRSLLTGQSCTISVRFAPTALSSEGAPFSGILEIRSNDPDPAQKTLSLQVSGYGNTLPPQAMLTAPADGAEASASPLLEWTQAADADGDAITHYVVLSRDAGFSDAAPQQVIVAMGAHQALLAGAGGLLLFGLGAGMARRKTGTILLLAGLALLVACGGGGGGSDAVSTGQPVETFSIAVTELAAGQELQPGTEYYWKVISEDARGGRSESAAWSFTTASSMQ